MIYEQTLEEANEIKSRPLPIWKEIAVKKTRATLRIFQYGEEPEIVYIFESGYTKPQIYHLIFEDGYESPIITQFWSAREIKEHLNIDL